MLKCRFNDVVLFFLLLIFWGLICVILIILIVDEVFELVICYWILCDLKCLIDLLFFVLKYVFFCRNFDVGFVLV